MPKTIANFKCNICGDVFTAKSDRYYECKCGKSKVKPNYISTSYDPNIGYNCERLQDGNDHTYYDESEVLVFDDELNQLYTRVRELAELLDFHIYESYVEKETGEKLLDYISMDCIEFLPGSKDEVNAIRFDIRLGASFEKPKMEDIKSRFNYFLEFLNKVNTGKINLSNRKQLTSEELNLYWDKSQLQKYDYTFYF